MYVCICVCVCIYLYIYNMHTYIGAVVRDAWLSFDYLIFGFGLVDLILDNAVVGKVCHSVLQCIVVCCSVL